MAVQADLDVRKKNVIVISAIKECFSYPVRPKSVMKRKLAQFDSDIIDDFRFSEEFKYLKDDRKPRIQNYISLMSGYSHDDFKARFRISRDSFIVIEDYITPILAAARTRNSCISYRKQILIFIYYCSTQDPLIRIADLFGVCETSVFDIIAKLSQLINRCLLKQFIKWPSGNEVIDVFQGFEKTRHFPKVIGAVDGTHIPIKTPKKDGEVYINRKKFHSINVAAVCDHQMMFTFVCVGWPGSTHDSRVFKNSKLGIACENLDKRNALFPNKCHILGDSAYELNEFLMTPFKDNGALTKLEKNYNFYHSSTRMKIENAFGSLKGRFRRLKYIDMHDPERFVDFITSCFVMHNICLLNSDAVDEYLVDRGIEETLVQEMGVDRDEDVAAVAKRRAISMLL